MSVQTEIDRLESAKEAIATAITGKGVTVPDGTMIDGMAALIASIEAGSGGGASATGLSILDTGTVTYSTSMAFNMIKITHNSGVIPRAFWMHTTDNSTDKKGLMSLLIVNIENKLYGADTARLNSSVISNGFIVPSKVVNTSLWTDTTIDNSTYNSGSIPVKTGVTYTWWCIG